MVLMNLSVSPSERWMQNSLHSSPSFYSDSSTPQTPKPSPSNSLSNLLSDDVEGIAEFQKALYSTYPDFYVTVLPEFFQDCRTSSNR
jgi:hypothetical protein